MTRLWFLLVLLILLSSNVFSWYKKASVFCDMCGTDATYDIGKNSMRTRTVGKNELSLIRFGITKNKDNKDMDLQLCDNCAIGLEKIIKKYINTGNRR